MKIKLRLHLGNHSRTVKLNGADEYTIGRSNADLTIGDPKCSRTHARLSLDSSGRLTVRDEKSTNGTLVNGERIESATLEVGNTIQIGRALLTLEDFSLENADEVTELGQTKDVILHSFPEAFRAAPGSKVKRYVNYLAPEDAKKSVRLKSAVGASKRKKAG